MPVHLHWKSRWYRVATLAVFAGCAATLHRGMTRSRLDATSSFRSKGFVCFSSIAHGESIARRTVCMLNKFRGRLVSIS